MRVRFELLRFAIFFAVGGVGYAIIELIWRGRTHPTMIVAGGLCFVLFSIIAQLLDGKPLIFKALLGAVCVTSVELIFGVVFNMALGMGVWDYSEAPYNFLGQICLLYSLYWVALGLVFIPLADKINRRLLRLCGCTTKITYDA